MGNSSMTIGRLLKKQRDMTPAMLWRLILTSLLLPVVVAPNPPIP